MIQKTIRRFGFLLSFAVMGLLLTSATANKAAARKHSHGRHGIQMIAHLHGKIRHNAFSARSARHSGKHFARLSRHHTIPQRALTTQEKSEIVQKIRALAESAPTDGSAAIGNTSDRRTSSGDDSVIAAEAQSPDIQSQIAEAAKEEQAEDNIDVSLDKYFKSRSGANAPDATAIDQSSAMAAALDPALDAERQPDITLFDETDPSHMAQRSDVMAEIIDWIGTRYEFGGEDRAGIDCSAFTREIYSKSFGLDLPRTAYDQSQLGDPVKKDDLQFGDLVFFKTARYAPITHVGIYIGEGLFANAACSRGVTVASLESEYWSQHYVAARRLFSNSGMAAANTPQAGSALADGN